MKLFLSSEGVPKPDLLRKLLGIGGEKARVAVINNAQDPYPEEKAKERGVALTNLFNALGFESVEVDLREYEGKTEELATILRTCKLIWCSGGNSFWLRYVMKTSGFDSVIKELLAEGIVYGGWSAGVVLVGPSLHPIELMDEPEKAPEIIYEGLGLIDYFIWPHWDTEKYKHLQAEAAERMAQLPHESVMLRDGEVLIVEDGVTRHIRNTGTRHIIVHLIRGEAKEAHEAITRDLVEQLDAFPIHDRIVPHLTLKRWFELDESGMEEVYKVLDEFTATHTQSEYRLHGFNNFGEGVIYVDADPSPEMSQTARDLMASMHSVKNMTFDEYDVIEDDFHATVAMRALKPFDFKKTWDYLLTRKPLDFNMKFDNIAILRKDTDKWVPERVWELSI